MLELTGQAPRFDRKAVRQALRQRQSRLAERIAGKRGGAVMAVHGASGGMRLQGHGGVYLRVPSRPTASHGNYGKIGSKRLTHARGA